MSETKHTPTPWRADYSGPASRAVEGPGGELIALGAMQSEDGDTDEANVAFIVRACNAHDALVKALANLDAAACNLEPSPARAIENTFARAVKAARAAIAKARGE